MLQVARLAPKQLGESCELVSSFIRSQRNEDGGFKDRSGNSDLYYTVFGLEALRALQLEVSFGPTEKYLRSFGSGESLDFVHLTCLARCWAILTKEGLEPASRRKLLEQIETFRSLDRGYRDTPHSPHGTVYGCFLALGAYQDLQSDLPNTEGLIHCLKSLQSRDGAFANQPHLDSGTTPATAAAVTLLRYLGEPVDPCLGNWLLSRCHPEGGFFAMPAAPVPDLLSTATALHALAGMQFSIDNVKEPCLDFIDSLWSRQGAFYGSWADDALDCEYTYYGLLGLGHLSL
jgi:prenyltransferase beta subunit